MHLIRIKASAVATLAFSNICLAQSTAGYPLPSKPVRVIVSTGTGADADIARVVKSPDIAKRLADEGGVPVGSTPDQFRLLIAEEIARWGKVVKDSGIRVE